MEIHAFQLERLLVYIVILTIGVIAGVIGTGGWLAWFKINKVSRR